ncbi:MAG: hypothetical protein F9K16_08115 [Thermoanaerobaculia bacterium]|jgi:O-antigen/teichoic acid export membrane protein|nr:MAG: hypothetical protein F9K16_08115 [Thermoanaerobaculia bacterium]MBZ0102849.1 DUF5671 domain-containing protein [Thermoanaerobaculia bacterium]
MAVEDRLSRFVEEALTRSVPRDQIETALSGAGWRPEEVREALGSFADAGLPLPVPRRRTYVSAKEAFLYLVLFTSLYIWIGCLGSLVFDLINEAWPDPAMQGSYGGADESIRWAVSWIIVAFPVFLGLSHSLQKSVRAEPTKRSSRVRKWLTYLTLYVAATTLLADVATLVYNALGGELTTRFLLKSLTVAILAGGVFGYYLTDLRVDEKELR